VRLPGILATIGLLGIAALANGPRAHAADVVVHAGQLIDGVSRSPRQHVSVLIHDDRIVSVTDGFDTPRGARIIDLSHATVLPGLIDAHVHLNDGAVDGDPDAWRVTHTLLDQVLEAVPHARKTLEAGFTSIRNVAAEGGTDLALKKAIADGAIEGPRMWVSLEALGPTGGHSDPRNGFDPHLSNPDWVGSVVDGPDEVRKAVRAHHQRGADLIKIMPSGGVLSVGDGPSLQLMSDDEIKAAVDTAHALGMKVAAHAHGKAAIDAAVRLGVDSIEHGSYADSDSFLLMKAHGVYLVPTLLVAKVAGQMAHDHPERMGPSIVAKALEVSPHTLANLAMAYKMGVKIAFGTDSGDLTPAGNNGR